MGTQYGLISRIMPKQKTYTFSLIDIEWFKQVVFKSRMARFLCSAIHAGAIELLNAFDIFSVSLFIGDWANIKLPE